MTFYPTPSEEFQQKRRTMMAKEISRGLMPYMLKYISVITAGWVLGMMVYHLVRHRPLFPSDLDGWLGYAIPALVAGVTSPIASYYFMKKQLAKAQSA